MDEDPQIQGTQPKEKVHTGKDLQMSSRPHLSLTVLIIVALIFVTGVGWYFYQHRSGEPVNHLIEGVPYYGIYNLAPDFSSLANATAMILGYWGDSRFSFVDLKNIFPDERYDPRENVDPTSGGRANNFFSQNGYGMFTLRVEGEEDVVEVGERYINIIKQYIADDVPVMVYQKLSDGYLNRYDIADEDPYTWRVVIGIFDDTETVIVHDRLLGNNYKYSFAEFKKLFTLGSGVLAPFPSEDLVLTLQKPIAISYPNRLPIMDSEGVADMFHLSGLAKRLASDADALCDAGFENREDISDEFVRLHKESVAYRDKVISHSSFSLAPPLFQLANKLWKARSLILVGEVTEGRRLLLEEVVPINHDLDKADGFKVHSASYSSEEFMAVRIVDGQLPAVWGQLALSYRLYKPEENLEKAIDAYRNWLKIDPNNDAVQKRLDALTKDLESGSTEVRNAEKYYYCMGGENTLQ